MSEEWRPVPGFEGQYEVSSLGRVRSWTRVLRLSVATGGYLNVSLGRAGGTHSVHVLVAAAFLGPKLPGQIVRHLDGTRQNNRVGNLAYGSYRDNSADSLAHGTRPVGELKPNHKLKALDLPDIRSRLGKESDSAIARDFGVNAAAIRHIRVGRSWRHV